MMDPVVEKTLVNKENVAENASKNEQSDLTLNSEPASLSSTLSSKGKKKAVKRAKKKAAKKRKHAAAAVAGADADGTPSEHHPPSTAGTESIPETEVDGEEDEDEEDEPVSTPRASNEEADAAAALTPSSAHGAAVDIGSSDDNSLHSEDRKTVFTEAPSAAEDNVEMIDFFPKQNKESQSQEMNGIQSGTPRAETSTKSEVSSPQTSSGVKHVDTTKDNYSSVSGNKSNENDESLVSKEQNQKTGREYAPVSSVNDTSSKTFAGNAASSSEIGDASAVPVSAFSTGFSTTEHIDAGVQQEIAFEDAQDFSYHDPNVPHTTSVTTEGVSRVPSTAAHSASTSKYAEDTNEGVMMPGSLASPADNNNEYPDVSGQSFPTKESGDSSKPVDAATGSAGAPKYSAGPADAGATGADAKQAPQSAVNKAEALASNKAHAAQHTKDETLGKSPSKDAKDAKDTAKDAQKSPAKDAKDAKDTAKDAQKSPSKDAKDAKDTAKDAQKSPSKDAKDAKDTAKKAESGLGHSKSTASKPPKEAGAAAGTGAGAGAGAERSEAEASSAAKPTTGPAGTEAKEAENKAKDATDSPPKKGIFKRLKKAIRNVFH
ncbi:cornified envelope assembly [Schizosaccharomyces osmophilus]|uniref:Cornified envelope assembly n=1 Tax=Schizosaccharomyces osmophilus TaxID=2545709 RepID=A0AAF0AW65_9SCHI|nr:cornified envelope assembly [Schizosaccharomyces osmophilus]WBW73247.1 cornified envelope assembly [Schizosaccharomyces osmophilus]